MVDRYLCKTLTYPYATMGSNLVRYEFECPSCNEGTIVDGLVREQLLEEGCVFCTAPVSNGNFDRH